MKKMVMWLRIYAEWISRQPVLDVAYAALHRTRSVTRPSPLMGLCYQATGEYESFAVGNQITKLPTGWMALASTHQGGCTSEPDGELGLWVVTLNVGDAPEFDSLRDEPIFLRAKVRHAARLTERYADVAACVLDRRETAALWIKASILALCACTLDDVLESGEGASLPPALEQAELFMRQHYTDSCLSVGEIAGAGHVGVRQLDRIFRQCRGQTPMQVLRSLRLDQACRLLESTGMRVGEIAREVGYDDALHFSRVFRAERGVSPIRYREQTRMKDGDEA